MNIVLKKFYTKEQVVDLNSLVFMNQPLEVCVEDAFMDRFSLVEKGFLESKQVLEEEPVRVYHSEFLFSSLFELYSSECVLQDLIDEYSYFSVKWVY